MIFIKSTDQVFFWLQNNDQVRRRREGEPGVSYLSSVEQEMVLSFALSSPSWEAGLTPSSMLESIILTL